jgi:putative SOS response-associated peptidase YedK
MCNRYTIVASAQEITNRFQVDVTDFYKPHYNAAPTQLLPIITHEASQGVSHFYWGAAPERASNKALSERIINTRVEWFIEKPVLKKALMQRRCMILADGFYDWKKVGKKLSIPYRFTRKDKNLFAFAGIWEEYEDDAGDNAHTFSIITTAANATVKSVAEYMPAILTPEAEKLWVNPQATEMQLVSLLQPYPAEWIDFYSVSHRLNTANLDVPSLILPTPPADQYGNLTLFG